jgi:hypothetical protein
MSLQIIQSSNSNDNPDHSKQKSEPATTTQVAYQYTPLIQPDRLIRQPISSWQNKQLDKLKHCIENDRSHNDIAVALNILAVLEAYQGFNDNALSICQSQINYWRNIAPHYDDQTLLPRVIQPWINIKRLKRWQNSNIDAERSYRELAPSNSSQSSSLSNEHGIEANLAQLFKLDPSWQSIVESVYWFEYTAVLTTLGDKSSLKQQVESGLRTVQDYSIRMKILEIWFGTLCRGGHFEYAMSALHRMKLTSGGEHQLAFELLELVLMHNMQQAQTTNQASLIFNKLSNNDAFAVNPGNLYMLGDIAKIYKHLGTQDQQIALLSQQYDYATKLNDEVLQFEARMALNQLGQDDIHKITDDFADSRYTVIRSKLNLAPLNDTGRSDLICLSLERLGQLDHPGCQSILNEL